MRRRTYSGMRIEPSRRPPRPAPRRFVPRRFLRGPRPVLVAPLLAAALAVTGCFSWSEVALRTPTPEPEAPAPPPSGAAAALEAPRVPDIEEHPADREIDFDEGRVVLRDGRRPIALTRGDLLRYDFDEGVWSLNGTTSFAAHAVEGMFERRRDVGRTVLASILYSILGTGAGFWAGVGVFFVAVLAGGGLSSG